MRRILLVLWLTVVLVGIITTSGIARTEANGNEDLRAELLKREDERNHAVLRGDVDLLNRVYADDLIYVNAFGETLTRAQHLANFGSGNLKMTKLSHTDTRLHLFGDTAIVTGLSTSTINYQGKVYSTPRKFTDVWVKQDGQWRFAVHHETFISKR